MNDSPSWDRSESQRARQRLLDRLLCRTLSAAPRENPWLPAGVRVALSSAQTRLWFLEQLQPGTPQYNVGISLRIDCRLDIAAIDAAVRMLMKRHDALRLRVVECDGQAFQEECDGLEPPTTVFDLRDLPASDAKARADAIAASDACRPFRLDTAPLFRIAAVLLPGEVTLLIAVFHHIIVDGWSVGIFLQEIAELISNGELPPAPHRYMDYVAWQLANTTESTFAPHLPYWRQKLRGVLPILDLPKDRPRPPLPTGRGRLLRFVVPADVAVRLRQFANQQGATMFMVLLAAYKVLLQRLTGLSDIIVGVPFAGRNHPDLARSIGFFINTVALRTDLGGDPTFEEVLCRVRATMLEAMDHQSVPFERVVEELCLPRESTHSPVFQTLFVLQNTPRSKLRVCAAATCETDLDTGTAKFDLTLSLTEVASEIVCLAEYFTDLFDEASVRRYVEAYLVLLEELPSYPDRPVRCHALLRIEERQRLLFAMNPPVGVNRGYVTLAQPFEEQVRRTPDAIAVTGEDRSLTYREVNERANRLAHQLLGRGVRRGDVVGVLMERSVIMVIALYGIAKSGAAYLPLDPEFPSDRLLFMLGDSGTRLVLTHAPARSALPEGPWDLLCLDDAAADDSGALDSALQCPGAAHHCAYLLYTSGSTGRPKAVAYPIDGSIAFLLWMRSRYLIGPGDSVLLKTPFGFDVSVWEFFWPLYAGATLVVCQPGGHRDPRYLADMIRRYRITAVNFVPSMLQAFLDEGELVGCQSLRWLLCAGEALPWRLRDAVRTRLGSARLVNLYGPTETGAVSDHIFEPNEISPIVPIGKPAAGFRLYILDSELEPLPIGVPGELFVGGNVGLAHGYHARPALTAERFIPDPFSCRPSNRLYRTGDICRYLPDGSIEFLGRRDSQVKVRGFRVDLQEIEAVLEQHEAVSACVVLAPGSGSEQRIVAFVVSNSDGANFQRNIMEHLRRFLPHLMMPSAVVAVDRIPTTINGKLDQDALLLRWRQHTQESRPEHIPAADTREEQLACCFAEILGLSHVDVTESFFDLGGHSLLVLKLAAACERMVGRRPSISQIFAFPTVRGLTAVLHAPRAASATRLVPLAPTLDKPVLLFLHAASGSVLPYAPLARCLQDDLSVFGMQAPGIDDDEPIPSSVEGFAQLYLSAVAKFLNGRPVFLAGWSFGGNVALELARLLQERGARLAGTILIDSWVGRDPGLAGPPGEESALALAFLGRAGLVPLGMPAPDMERVKRVLEASVKAFRSHAPQYYDGTIDLLRAREPFPPEMAGESAYGATDGGWTGFARHVVVHSVPGHHFELMSNDSAPTLARTIRMITKERLDRNDMDGEPSDVTTLVKEPGDRT
ncbi:non-ribosomal peptide synthetase [Bradyrhizobium sp.]